MYDDILFFVKIAAYGKFSAAAEGLGIAQSTISRKIASLEEQLNLRLIKRDSRNLELTEAGLGIYNRFQHTAADIEEKIATALIADKRYENILNLMLPVGMANFGFSRKLAELNERLPGVQLNLTYYAGTIDIEKYNYSLAIVSRANKKEYQSARLIYSSKVILVCSPEYIANYGLCQSIEDMANHKVIGNVRVLEDNVPQMLFNEHTGDIIEIHSNYKLYLNSFIESRNLVMSGVAISGLMEADIKHDLADGSLLRLLPDYHGGFMNYYLVSKFDEQDLRYKEVLNLLEEFFKHD